MPWKRASFTSSMGQMMSNRLGWTAILLCVLALTLTGGGAVRSDIIGGEGYKVLVVYESSDSLPKEQGAVLRSSRWKELVDDWRVLDKDSVFNDEDSVWKKALNRPSEHLPRVIISTGYEGPLPEEVDAMVALVEKWK